MEQEIREITPREAFSASRQNETDMTTKQKVTDAVFDAVERCVGHEIKLSDTYNSLGLGIIDLAMVEAAVMKRLECQKMSGVFDILYNDPNTATVEELIDAICKHLGI